MGWVVRVLVWGLKVRKDSGEREMMAWRVGGVGGVVLFGYESSSKQVKEPIEGFVVLKRCWASDFDEPVKGRVMGWVRLTW